MKNTIDQKNPLIEGSVFKGLLKFIVPIFFSLVLQTLYGSIDMIMVGKYGSPVDLSGIGTGAMVMYTLMSAISCLGVGVTVLIGEEIGKKNYQRAGKAIGSGILLFSILAIVMTFVMRASARSLTVFMDAPQEAFEETYNYIRICGTGCFFIIAYNLLGSIYRGLGDSKTPLISVLIAGVFNLIADYVAVKVLGMGCSGAAYATVIAQGLSVIISVFIIFKNKDKLLIDFNFSYIGFNGSILKEELLLGIPTALQELLANGSFMLIQMMVNGLGVTSSAAFSIGEDIGMFIFLIPTTFMQGLSAYTAQNIGANKLDRAIKGFKTGWLISLIVDIPISYIAFFHGDKIGSFFTSDQLVYEMTGLYLKAYAIDCLLSPIMFSSMGFLNGVGKTVFVMIQGIVGAFVFRVPVVWLVLNKFTNPDLFKVGLSIPISTFFQNLLCLIAIIVYVKKKKETV